MRDDRMPFDFSRAFYRPVFGFFVLKAAIVADEFFQFAIFIFPASYAKNLGTFHPDNRFSAAFWAIAVCIERVGKPNTAFKPEGSVGQRSNGANINHIS